MKPRYETPTRTVADPNWLKWITHQIQIQFWYFDNFEKHDLMFVLTDI